jgi:hypothetical protein
MGRAQRAPQLLGRPEIDLNPKGVGQQIRFPPAGIEPIQSAGYEPALRRSGGAGQRTPDVVYAALREIPQGARALGPDARSNAGGWLRKSRADQANARAGRVRFVVTEHRYRPPATRHFRGDHQRSDAAADYADVHV